MNKDEKLKILKDLVEIKTVAENEELIALYVKKLLLKYGINSEIVPQFNGRSNLVAEIGDHEGRVLGFAGHEDTVHEGNIEDWHSNPFKATIKDGYLYGRGVTDMKSGLASMVIAIIELKQDDVKINGKLRLLLTISEELTQGGAHELSEQGYLDDIDSLIIGEPTGNNDNSSHSLVYAHKGALIYTIESVGKAAHSSTPENGIDAIENLLNYRLLEKNLFKSFNQKDDALGKTIYTPNILKGGKQVNSIPDFAYEKVMVRTIPELPNVDIIKKLQLLIKELNTRDKNNLSLQVNFSGNPVKSDPDSKIINNIEELSGNSFPLKTMSMGTDASQYYYRNKNMDLVVFGPGNTTAHQTDEFIDIKTYYDFIELYKKIAIKYLD